MTQAISEVGSISFEERTSKQMPYEWGFGSTPRTAALRAALKWKAAVVKDFEDVFTGLAKCEFRKGEQWLDFLLGNAHNDVTSCSNYNIRIVHCSFLQFARLVCENHADFELLVCP